MKLIYVLFSCLAISCVQKPVGAQVYRCVTDTGGVLYADRPCDPAAERIELDTVPVPNSGGHDVLVDVEEFERLRQQRRNALRERQETAWRDMERQREERELENVLRREAARGNVHTGMTENQVIHAWGRPDAVNRNASGQVSREQWHYHRAPRGHSGSVTVRFQDGRVTSLRHRERNTRR